MTQSDPESTPCHECGSPTSALLWIAPDGARTYGCRCGAIFEMHCRDILLEDGRRRTDPGAGDRLVHMTLVPNIF